VLEELGSSLRGEQEEVGGKSVTHKRLALFSKAIFEPNHGVNLTTFIQSCNISVQGFIAFTDFTIADNVPILRRILADNGTSAPKYPLTPIKPSYAPGFTPA